MSRSRWQIGDDIGDISVTVAAWGETTVSGTLEGEGVAQEFNLHNCGERIDDWTGDDDDSAWDDDDSGR